MGTGVSIVLLAVGAIMTFALRTEAEGIDLGTVGIILMIAGGIGLLASLFFWERMTGGAAGRRTYVRDERVL